MSARVDPAVRFERVAGAYGDRLLAYLLRRVPEADAPDVAAETLLTAWRRVRSMPADDEEAFWWLLAMARLTAANHRRGAMRRAALVDRLRALPVSVASTDDDVHAALREAVADLWDDDRELVRLVYWDGLRVNAAAAVLGIGEAAARKRLQRARDSLRATLTESARAERR